MITEPQLSNFVLDHIYLFCNEIQANSSHLSFHSNNQPSLIDRPYQEFSSQSKKAEERVKPELKVDLWKINQNINNHQIHQKEKDYVGPILSFQRRQIWSKNPSPNHQNNTKTIKQRTHSTPKPYLSTFNQQNETTQLADTVVNPSGNKRNSMHTYSHHKQLYRNPHSVSKNHEEELRSTVKPYSVDQSKFKQQNLNNPAFDSTLKSRLNNFLQHKSHQSSQIQRKHKIFSLSSKPSRKVQQSGNSINQYDLAKENDQVLIRMQEKGRAYRNSQNLQLHLPKSFNNKNINRKPAAQQESVFIEDHQINNSESLPKEQHVKFNILQKQSESNDLYGLKDHQKDQKLSIVDHFATIPHAQQISKYKPMSQFQTLNQTDYVPSPSQLSTIIKTIQKQSRQTRQSRRDTHNRKSLYHKRLNNSIRYHEKNFYEPLQAIQKDEKNIKRESKITREPYHLKEQFVPLPPEVFQPNQLLNEHPAKIKFSYVNAHTTQHEF